MLLVLLLYTWAIGPTIADWRDDWMFLHAARVQAIQQQIQQQQQLQQQQQRQQQQQQPQPPKEPK